MYVCVYDVRMVACYTIKSCLYICNLLLEQRDGQVYVFMHVRMYLSVYKQYRTAYMPSMHICSYACSKNIYIYIYMHAHK
jgi:hypothetical protein